jgi:hypothetical protein
MRYRLMLLLITLTPMNSAPAQPRSILLPTAIKVSLDRRYPGWSFATVSQDVTQLFGSYPRLAGALPHLIKGDFDGDGKADYAVLIVHGKVLNAAGVAVERGEKLIVFLRRGRSYKSRRLENEAYIADVYLALARKGEKAYNYETNRTFTYENDAIDLCYFEKGGTSYIYRKGRFRRVITGD